MFIYVPLRSNKKIQENTTTTFNQVSSLYSQYISQTDIDRGEKILCFFALVVITVN